MVMEGFQEGFRRGNRADDGLWCGGITDYNCAIMGLCVAVIDFPPILLVAAMLR